MSASQLNAIDAVAFQLASALERYDTDVQAMVDGWLDMDRYHAVSGDIEEIRMYCHSLPQLGVAWAELLISHAELVHGLWRSAFSDGSRSLDEVRLRHSECVQVLRAQCMRSLGVR